ncbi:MAG: hypothetical protein LW724_19250 [Planctomycetaceae bacterium]|nr:hypothetical protein [Planctomycetaceae bacterium]
MNRLIAFLLMPFLLVGDCFAHSHGHAAHDSTSHARPHIHVGAVSKHNHGHDHKHDHDGNPPCATPEVPVEHDADAVYFVDADSLFTISERSSIEFEGLCLPETIVAFSHVAIRQPRDQKAGPYWASELPLYLLHAALRI